MTFLSANPRRLTDTPIVNKHKIKEIPMPEFHVVSDYKPSGDQPEAIDALAKGIELGFTDQTLIGVTGSGITFTMA